MAKSKNHTNHNQNRKAHRNPIRRPKKQKHPSMRGVEPKFLRNMKFARKHNLPGPKQKMVAAARAKKREALAAKISSV
ncbi:60S ribosomal protein L29-1-like [Portunus trituberculatus]|uniref:60S ribosomal protein L29 n=1 Tax=Portunus trituberculatus TaxID=210409 RepID=A0A5B7E2U6_PORTR|nr:60S ribosomal protein L29-1-like [Portunus trituberculatus]XP_045124684.1 60S ribosomal protein L29-1-like [Portunus trituberculatus]MPC27154.1 60S ribosomal protein L29 [Portunus trituberculatus]